ncbi:cell division protein FtsL [Ruminiclostridium sufflavum DSM 19573]|uniref:Cell division protein FtsL n=1 Tax=Ruminiclostridium sufflavum DSM 19573 TaxID=1121337 RepID=A0A318Y862_9FIRM|nr:cell division protein FtsL [Ruminiclostridium sufflavum]PYG88434.1 cell division protein FtsL [Ruminiclostridium sufflavum DSM 19573]
MAASKNKYVYGSVAENIENDIYDPYEENAVLKSKKIARNNKKLKAKITFCILTAFSLCALTMFRYAQISQLSYENEKLNKQYIEMQNDNQLLSIEIQNAKSLRNIREVAENSLHMHKPNKSQIVYVEVPKEDITMTASKEKSKIGIIIEDIENSLKKVLNIF